MLGSRSLYFLIIILKCPTRIQLETKLQAGTKNLEYGLQVQEQQQFQVLAMRLLTMVRVYNSALTERSNGNSN